MRYESLDDDELLRLSLEATGSSRDADAMVLLKTLVERNPENAIAHYLLAAQHAQVGMADRAEQGFRQALDLLPDMVMARFQLGQLLLLQGDGQGAARELRRIRSDDPAIAPYAEGLCALAEERPEAAIASLRRGLAATQSIPALADDMRRLLDGIEAVTLPPLQEPEDATASVAAPMLLSNYSRYN